MLTDEQIIAHIASKSTVYAAFHPIGMLNAVVFGIPMSSGEIHREPHDVLIDVRPVVVVDALVDDVVRVSQVVAFHGGDAILEAHKVCVKTTDLFLEKKDARQQCIDWGLQVFGRAHEFFLMKSGKPWQLTIGAFDGKSKTSVGGNGKPGHRIHEIPGHDIPKAPYGECECCKRPARTMFPSDTREWVQVCQSEACPWHGVVKPLSAPIKDIETKGSMKSE